MPASTSDPISSVLQRTFNGMDSGGHRREGLMRGGNSASVTGSTASLEMNIQASTQRSLLLSSNGVGGKSSGIEFDNPIRYTSGSGLQLQQQSTSNGGGHHGKPKMIVLNSQYTDKSSKQNQDQESTANGKNDTAVTIPKPKVGFLNLNCSLMSKRSFLLRGFQVVFFRPANVEVGYRKMRSSGAGMFNMGNTCYLNSTLQALFHTPALFNYLMYEGGSQHVSKCGSSGIANGFMHNCTICAMTHTLRDTMRSNVIKPGRISDKLKSICKFMVHGRQEDAHEFLRYLVDSLQRSYLSSMRASKDLDMPSKETTPFNQIFGGYLRQDITCLKCKHVSTTFQHFMDLLLDIRHVNTIEEALQHHFRQERLGNSADEANMYKCEKCKVKVQARKRCFIEQPPAVLCIQLKRFTLLGGKISKPVRLSHHINMANYINPRSNAEGSPVQYKLVSMITHVGPSPNCGHYTAIGEAGSGQFFQFDDSHVRMIPLGQVLQTASYVVFYEMTRSSWAHQIARRSGGQHQQQQQRNPSPMPPRPVSSAANSLSGSRSSLSSNGSNASNSILKPRLITSSGVANKFGVVAKNAVATIARTVTNTMSKAGNNSNKNASSLVPYGGDSSSSSDEDNNEASSTVVKKAAPGSLTPRPSFIPRSVTVKNLQHQTKPASPSPTPTSTANGNGNGNGKVVATAVGGKWTVSDVEQHNPSVHSDNSTGSTSCNWTISANNGSRPSSAMSDDTTASHSSASKWTVTPLKKAIQEPAVSSLRQDSANGSKSSTPTSSASSSITTSSSSSSSWNEKKRKSSIDSAGDRGHVRKRPSLDEDAAPPPTSGREYRDYNNDDNDYDAELDRGRTKKVKKSFDSSNGRSGNGDYNPFQAAQNQNNHQRSASLSSSSRDSHWGDRGNGNRSWNGGHQRHSYRGGGGSDKHSYQRRRSYGGSGDYRDHHRKGGGGGGYHQNAGFNRSYSSGGYHHRDFHKSHHHRR